MRLCMCCGEAADEAQATCPKCGEASWSQLDQPMADDAPADAAPANRAARRAAAKAGA